MVASTMHALASPSRVRILARLAVGPRSVSALASELEMAQPAVSQQLRVLRKLGFVTRTRKGRRAIYTLSDKHVAALLREAVAHGQHLGLG